MLNTPSARLGSTRTHHDGTADAAVGTFIPVHAKRVFQAKFVMGLTRELPAVFTVVAASASVLQGEHDGAGLALAAAELIAGAGVLFAIVLEARHLFARRAEHGDGASAHHASRVDVSNLAAAALGYVEAWHHARAVGHFKLVSPYMVGATTSLLLARMKPRAVLKRRPRRRPHVGITPDGISYLGGRRRKWQAAWSEVAAVEHEHGELAVRLHDGRRHVLRADYHLDGESVLAKTRAAIAAHAPHISVAGGRPTSAGLER
jgi:hypothetical protein